MARQELKIDVQARLLVSDEMVDRCLRLLEMWQSDHPEQKVMGDTNKDGSIRFYREKREKLERLLEPEQEEA